MKVSELAAQAGVAPSAVRFYESRGVLPQAERGHNRYRKYTSDDVSRLRLVVALRRLGVGMDEAGRLAQLCLTESPRQAILVFAERIAEQRGAIARQRAELDQLEAELSDLELVARAGAVSANVPTAANNPIRIVFVCTGNSARSQMAEALLQRIGGADFVVRSAGTEPRGVHPETVAVLKEIGIDWSAARSKSVDELVGEAFDYVITVCDRARQVCPAFPGSHDSLHWGLDDPVVVKGAPEQRRDAFRRTRTELSMRLRPFAELARRARRSLAGAE